MKKYLSTITLGDLEDGGEVDRSGAHFPLCTGGTPSRSEEQSEQTAVSQHIWRLEAKIVEDIEKQMVRKLHWYGRVPGTSTGTRAIAAPGPVPAGTCHRILGREPNQQLPPWQTGRIEWHQDGPGCLKSLGGIKMKWETQRDHIHPLRLWTPAASLPEKLGSWLTPGEGKRVGLWWTLTKIVSSLVGKLGCVRGLALVRSGRLELDDFVQKTALRGCLGNSLQQPPSPPWLHPAVSLRGRRWPPLQRRGSRAQGVSSPQKDLTHWGAELPWRDFESA